MELPVVLPGGAAPLLYIMWLWDRRKEVRSKPITTRYVKAGQKHLPYRWSRGAYTLQTILMRIYIIREGRRLELYTVSTELRPLFLARKGRRILAWGESLPQAVAQLPLPQKLAVLRELSKK